MQHSADPAPQMQPDMASRKELLSQVYKLVPPMLESFHKGQLGRVAVIGGSEDYTGAPYFSAMASARLGADMSHVICEPAAAAVIKTYSPVLMVHPYMRSSKTLNSSNSSASGSGSAASSGPEGNETIDSVSQQVIAMLDRLHVVVIGPGLGRDKVMLEICARVISEARRRNMPFVLDADGLHLASTRPELIERYDECILTPNVVEFGRLARSRGLDLPDPGAAAEGEAGRGTEGGQSSKKKQNQCAQLAKSFGGVTIIQKGETDYISNGDEQTTFESSGKGGLKRTGGQGDTLTGCLATLLAYRKAYHDELWDIRGTTAGTEEMMSRERTLALVAYGASAITRECSRLAFLERGRSLQAADLTDHVHQAFLTLIGEPTEGIDA